MHINPRDIMPEGSLAEQAILAMCLFDSSNAIPELVEQGIQPDMFFKNKNILLCKALFSLFESGSDCTLISVSNFLEHKNKLNDIGGISYLFELASDCYTLQGIDHYCSIVKEKFILRKLKMFSAEINQMVLENKDSSDILSRIDFVKDKISDEVWTDSGARPVQDYFAEYREHLKDRMVGKADLSSGIKELDGLIYSFKLPSYNFIYGRLKSGKTTLALNIAVAQIANNIPTLFMSLEMRTIELAERILRIKGGVNRMQLYPNNTRIENTMDELANSSLFIMQPEPLLGKIFVNIRQEVKKNKIKMVILENLDLILTDSQYGQKEHERLSSISKQIQHFVTGMARNSMPIAFILIGQANRESRLSKDGFPLKGNVAGTDQVGRDVDLMLAIADPEVTGFDHENETGIKVAAHRQDVKGFDPIWLNYDPQTFKIGGAKRTTPFTQGGDVPF